MKLKSGVDLQLQAAFDQGNWSAVARLAERRAKTFNDQYYEIVKVCAEAQGDSPAEKAAAVAAVEKYLANGTVVKDVEAIDLLEWAIWEVADEADVSRLLGPLQLRLVKANPSAQNAVTRCFESCLLHWDLVTAQQIAAILDKTFPGTRMFLFWNIAATYLLAVDEQCPPEKRALYGMLALKQIQRAAQIADQAVDAETKPERAVQTEEETLLLYSILDTHGSDAEWRALLNSPIFSPHAQLKLGRKEPFLRTLDYFERKGDWVGVYGLCSEGLSAVDENGRLNLFLADWAIWRRFIYAASQVKEDMPEVYDDVAALISGQASSPNCRPLHSRILCLARLELAFQLGNPPTHFLAQGPPTQRLEELSRYIDTQLRNPVVFDDIRGFVERLDAEEMAYFSRHIMKDLLSKVSEDAVAAGIVLLFQAKMRYFISTCPQSLAVIPNGSTPAWKCLICENETAIASCAHCLADVAATAMSLYRTVVGLNSLGETAGTYRSVLAPEAAILVATCCIKLSGLGLARQMSRPSPLHGALTRRVLQAALILEHQLGKTPNHGQVTLMLVRLYLILGCASRARELWDGLDIKRTTIDSLAPLFCDRASTIAPTLVLSPDRPDEALMNGVQSHYSASLKTRMPRRLIDAFAAESYSSILSIPKYHNKLRTSGTMVMGQLEEAHAARMLAAKGYDRLDDPNISSINDTTILGDRVDYGALPNLESNLATPIQQLLQLGPGPSNERSHLTILADEFFALLAFKLPSLLKPTSQTHTVDHTYVLESLDRLERSFNKFLRQRRLPLTTQERTYFELLSFLARLVPLATAATRADTPSVLIPRLTAGVTGCLSMLHAAALSLPTDSADDSTLLMLAAAHGLSHLRDGATAVRLAAAHVTAFNERERERDGSGKSCLHKETLAVVATLDAAAKRELQLGKARVQLLATEAAKPAFGRWAVEWTLGPAEAASEDRMLAALKEEVADEAPEWAALLVESWRDNVKGWQQVKWA